MNKVFKLLYFGILLITFLCCGCSSHLYHPQNKQELRALVYDANINLGDIDTSKITDMRELFAYSAREDFSGMETWDTSNVQDMSWMFEGADNFNQDIGSWDVSNVQDMRGMFYIAISFNQNIDRWDVSNVEDMSGMFDSATNFNQDIGRWDVSNVENMEYMFHGAENFNQDISKWNTSNVRNMNYMFYDASNFNQDISKWNVGYLQCEHTGINEYGNIFIIDITETFIGSPLESNPPL